MRLVVAGLMFVAVIVAGGPSAQAAGTISVTQDWTNDPGQYITDDGCFGVDGQAHWTGSGTLDPGQSYVFNPAYPTCAASEIPAIVMHVDWAGATRLSLETTNPFAEPTTKLASSIGFHQLAPVMTAAGGRQQANLCMFTDPYATDTALGYDQSSSYGPPVNWSVKITNIGTQAATLSLTGQETDGWPAEFYSGCARADADGDHWNDTIEEDTLFLSGGDSSVSPMTMGGFYENAAQPTNVDNYMVISPDPADFNADGAITQSDVDAVQQRVGEGNGLPLDELSPNGYVDSLVANPLCSTGITATTFAKQAPWRRYDLDGDGCITSHDATIVQALVGKSLPLQGDYVAPWAVITSPNTVSAKASYFDITGFASDNDLLAHVDVYAGGKLICTSWSSALNKGLSPGYHCNWQSIPRRAGTKTTIMMKAYDNAGLTYSTTQVVTTK